VTADPRRRPPRRPHKSAPRRHPLDPARGAAFDVLRAVSERDAYANLTLPPLLNEGGITGRDAAFATELAYGTCRTRGLLDAIIAAAADRPVEQIHPVLLDLLRLGAYQLLRTRVDSHAAVSTTVEQAGIEFDSARAGFVNAVLRTIASRDEQSWIAELAPDPAVDPVGHAAFMHAHPRWIAQSFADALGSDAGELDALLASDNARPTVQLAARPGSMTAHELAAAVDGTVGRYSPYAVYLSGGGDPGRLHPLRDRKAQVQDEGSQLVARALVLAELDGDDGGRWLDLCAGPGGKTALLAALGAASGARVTAVEPAPHRRRQCRNFRLDGAIKPEHPHLAVGRQRLPPKNLGEPAGPIAPLQLHLEQPVLGMGKAEPERGILIARSGDQRHAIGIAGDPHLTRNTMHRNSSVELWQ